MELCASDVAFLLFCQGEFKVLPAAQTNKGREYPFVGTEKVKELQVLMLRFSAGRTIEIGELDGLFRGSSSGFMEWIEI